MAYTPSVLPTAPTIEELIDYLEGELLAIAQEFRAPSDVDYINFNPSSKSAAKVKEGMLAWSDGTRPPPLNSKGLYQFTNGTWSKL